MFLVRERAADRRRRAVSDASAACVAQPLVWLVEVPETPRPAAEIARVVTGHERPVLRLDLRPQLRGEPSRADRARAPREAGVDARAIRGNAVQIRKLGGALLEDPFAIRRGEPLDRIDQRRQCGFTVGSDGEVDLL